LYKNLCISLFILNENHPIELQFLAPCVCPIWVDLDVEWVKASVFSLPVLLGHRARSSIFLNLDTREQRSTRGKGGQNMHCIEQGIEEHDREGRPEHALYRAGNRGAREGREAKPCTV
jgi:hypothetical protein